MTDNAKKFLELVSKDEALKKELKDSKDPNALLKLAEAKGFNLTAEDFGADKMSELSEDELKAVAGVSLLLCGQIGEVNAHNLVCKCNKGGSGYDPEGGPGLGACGEKFGIGWN